MSRMKLAVALALLMMGLAGWDGWLTQDTQEVTQVDDGRVRAQHDGTSFPPN